jgi:hypothetical protein
MYSKEIIIAPAGWSTLPAIKVVEVGQLAPHNFD